MCTRPIVGISWVIGINVRQRSIHIHNDGFGIIFPHHDGSNRFWNTRNNGLDFRKLCSLTIHYAIRNICSPHRHTYVRTKKLLAERSAHCVSQISVPGSKLTIQVCIIHNNILTAIQRLTNKVQFDTRDQSLLFGRQHRFTHHSEHGPDQITGHDKCIRLGSRVGGFSRTGNTPKNFYMCHQLITSTLVSLSKDTTFVPNQMVEWRLAESKSRDNVPVHVSESVCVTPSRTLRTFRVTLTCLPFGIIATI